VCAADELTDLREVVSCALHTTLTDLREVVSCALHTTLTKNAHIRPKVV
jgi:hypothetical protein